MDEPILPSVNSVTPPAMPSPKAQSWGAILSIVIIVLMIIVGAFYAWGQRISQSGIPVDSASTTAQ